MYSREVSMRKFAGLTLAVLIISSAASAQIPGGNIFVGYSLSQTRPALVNLNGWEGSLEGKFLPWIGIVADFSAGYGTNNFFPPIACVSPCLPRSQSVRRYTYMLGPRVSIPVGRFTPFVNAFFGAAHINDQGITDNSFATAFGGGLDYRLIHGLALRVQADSLHTDFFNISENHFRFATGIDIRF
jgi:opacity protein-like surface antigen